MSSDADYEAFLNQANQDPTTQSSNQVKQKSSNINTVNTSVPDILKKQDGIFISESDEPFKPISLSYQGNEIPSPDDLSTMIGVKAHKITQQNFDPKTKYSAIISAVKEAGDGTAHFFQVKHDSTRVEYLIISLDTKESRLVGLRALAIES